MSTTNSINLGTTKKKISLNSGHGLTSGVPVTSTYEAADATDSTKPAIGIASIDGDILILYGAGDHVTLTLAEWKAVIDDGADPVIGEYYWLSDTAGKITRTQPSNYIQPILTFNTTTTATVDCGDMVQGNTTNIATQTEAQEGASDTLLMSPLKFRQALNANFMSYIGMASKGIIHFDWNWAVPGNGTNGIGKDGSIYTQIQGTDSGTSSGTQNLAFKALTKVMSPNANVQSGMPFSEEFILCNTICIDLYINTGNVARFGLKKNDGVITTSQAIYIEYRDLDIWFCVHDGTNLTEIDTGISATQDIFNDIMIYSDGTGNCSLYVDGNLAALTAAGPSTGTLGTVNNSDGIVTEAINTNTSGSRMLITNRADIHLIFPSEHNFGLITPADIGGAYS